MKITLIAAHGLDRSIGRDSQIPWHYAEDFAHFRRETEGGVLIMGRLTYESIGRPLPKRRTLVISRDENWTDPLHPQVKRVGGPDEALSYARSLSVPIFVAGGAQIYSLFMRSATHQILTLIPVRIPDADSHYPAYDEAEWVTEKEVRSEAGLVYSWLSRING